MKHVVIWVAIIATLYPVIYLVGVSFNRNNALAAVPPREGNLLVRSGVIPDPADLSLVQYGRVLSESHLYAYQWALLALVAVAAFVFIALKLWQRVAVPRDIFERLGWVSGWALAAGVLILLVSLDPDQFYSVGADGQRLRASSGGMMVLYIRNTLLVSTVTGLFAVLLSTTAGYAFARLRFEGRYGTLLTFVFAQMFPSFMALVAIFYLMNYLGLLNTYTGLILAYSGSAIAFSSVDLQGLPGVHLPEPGRGRDGGRRDALGSVLAHHLAHQRADAAVYLSLAVHRHLQRVHFGERDSDLERQVDRRLGLARAGLQRACYRVGHSGGERGAGQFADSHYFLLVSERVYGAVHGGRC